MNNIRNLTDPVRERRLIAAADLPTLRRLTGEPGDTGSMARAELFLRAERTTDGESVMHSADRLVASSNRLEALLGGNLHEAPLR